jgi:osmotically-inducible protein OsmY
MELAPPITLSQRVEHAIVHNPHLNGCNIHYQTDDAGKLTIEGEAETFFAKQMAQEILRRVKGVQRIENELTVDW